MAIRLAVLLGEVPAGRQLVVNATSASGAVLESWAKEGRTLITANKSGGERNATRFGAHWTAALSSDEADANKNGAITVQEAFDYTARKVTDSFEGDGTLATEHPQLVGDAANTLTLRFSRSGLPLRQSSSGSSASWRGLEGEIAVLRQRREDMDSAIYLDELQALLLDLALVQREIDAAHSAE